ncbi:MAG: hypothetical protein QM817_00390 [Archangium sp.]
MVQPSHSQRCSRLNARTSPAATSGTSPNGPLISTAIAAGRNANHGGRFELNAAAAASSAKKRSGASSRNAALISKKLSVVSNTSTAMGADNCSRRASHATMSRVPTVHITPTHGSSASPPSFTASAPGQNPNGRCSRKIGWTLGAYESCVHVSSRTMFRATTE